MSKRALVPAEAIAVACKRTPAAESPQNPLLAILPKVEVDIESFEYKTHREWEDMQSEQGCKNVFKKWYEKHGAAYRHERHAFNYFCKHCDGIKLKQVEIIVDGRHCTVLWTVEIRDLPTRVYQILCGRAEHIATIEGGAASVEVGDLEPLKELIEKLCA